MSSTTYAARHLGADSTASAAMAKACGFPSLDALIDATVPAGIRTDEPLDLPPPLGEFEAVAELRTLMSRNRVVRSFIGQGYYGTIVPPVIQRNVLENPAWYTAYTPYQAEISQGRLEALLNFQTMVTGLTGLPVANASLLDEGTAAAEAAAMALNVYKGKGRTLFVDRGCFAQSIAVLRTRMEALGIGVMEGSCQSIRFAPDDGVFAAVVQYPDACGDVHDYTDFAAYVHQQGALLIAAADILALAILQPPGAWGADIAVGSTQRFGIPMGGGGPHAAYMAVRDDLKRKLPGRLVGVSVDAHGAPAMRLSLQTREQHIRRDKATSNICTAQVLLAVMAGFYAVWHGPDGLRSIARRVHALTGRVAAGLRAAGIAVVNGSHFDTLTILIPGRAEAVHHAAAARGYQLRSIDADMVGLSCDELTTDDDVSALLDLFGAREAGAGATVPQPRTTGFLQQDVFQSYHTEHELLRYLQRLASRDLTLCDSMIPLGSCTMKLNASSAMQPLSWPEVANMHPLAPAEHLEGYGAMMSQLEDWLSKLTGLAATSVAPNSGSQGEFAGLLAIRAWHRSRGDEHRRTCLIPVSAHGTNPASAVMAGMTVVPVRCDEQGNIDLADLRAQAAAHSTGLAALMITYPSTHGVFEESVREVCRIVHDHGGQVYMDGANMNAQVGLTSPGRIGADVCHLNLHKTFCIPHGGGGPGVGPVCVASHLVPFIPGRGVVGPVVSAPYGSASINCIPWMYIRMMGGPGLTRATMLAILNANYIARKLEPFFPVLYKGRNGLVAHECIIDVRPFKDTGVTVEDVAKRLIDYGYHAPTMSWPVPGTLMIEPTESESRAELDRFCAALISIHGEMRAIQTGESERDQNVLRHAPHTAASLLTEEWTRPYTRESAAFPDDYTRRHKYWPPVGRVDNVYGDKNLVCTCEAAELLRLDKQND